MGMEKPVSDAAITEWSKAEPRRTAAKMPAGRPIKRATVSAQTESSMVAGKSVRNSSKTGCLVTIDLPRLPLRISPRKPKYCSHSGRSKPISCSSRAWRAGSMPRSPTRSSIGSPGISRMKAKAASVTPMKVGTTMSRRVMMKRSMSPERNSSAQVPPGAIKRRNGRGWKPLPSRSIDQARTAHALYFRSTP